jgi:Protein of unknown function (DUF2723)
VDRSVAQGRRLDPSTLVPAIAVATVAFVAAWMALQPGVEFWDTGEFQTIGPLLGTGHPTGYPTYVLVGWLASVILQPLGEPAFRMNLLSALLLAVAAGVTVDLVRALTRSAGLGMVAGLGLALTPIAWSIGTHADPHALHVVFVAVLLRLLVAWADRVEAGTTTADRWLVAAAVVFGLSAGNHSLTLLLAPAIGLYVLTVAPSILRRPRFILTCAGALVLTLVAVYLELPLRAGPFRAPLVYGTPETWDGFWYVVLGEQFRGDVSPLLGGVGAKAADLVSFTVAQFGALAAFIPIAFVVTAIRRPAFAVLTGPALLATCLFNASYENADIGRYYLGPALIAWTWLAILAGVVAEGAASLVAGRLAWLTHADAPDDSRPAGSAALAGAVSVLMLVPTVSAVSPRLEAVDRTRDVRAADWLDGVLPVLEPDAIVISGWSFSTTLWYAQLVEGRRPDIVIVDDQTRRNEDLGTMTSVIEANLGQRPVYLIRQNKAIVPYVESRYVVDYPAPEEIGLLIHVLERRVDAP